MKEKKEQIKIQLEILLKEAEKMCELLKDGDTDGVTFYLRVKKGGIMYERQAMNEIDKYIFSKGIVLYTEDVLLKDTIKMKESSVPSQGTGILSPIKKDDL